jgi:hypothetical protein
MPADLGHRNRTVSSTRFWPTADSHDRQLTGSLIAVPMLTMAPSKSHHLQHAIEPNRRL